MVSIILIMGGAVMNSPHLRVCLVAPYPPPYGGIANWTLLIHRCAQIYKNIDLHIVDTAPRWRAIYDLSFWKRAIGGGLQLLRDYILFLQQLCSRPDVVHLTTSGQLAVVRDLAIMATARLAGIPSIYHIRFGRIPQIATQRTYEWRLLTKAICLAHTIIAIDPATAATLTKRFPNIRTLRIPNGIDLHALPPSHNRSTIKTVLFLGHVIPTKGISELVQAWTQFKVEGWRCVIAGPGSEAYRSGLLQIFKPKNLEFFPEQSHKEAMRLLAASDILILPSHTEGFPNVIIEAMALGKSTIATSVGAIPEMLSNNCGMVVPPKNTRALEKALYQLCSDKSLRKSMGARARSKAHTEYSIDRVFEQLISTWRESSRKRRFDHRRSHIPPAKLET